jgi:hypothetical protein
MIAAGTPGATGLQLSDATQHTSSRRTVDGNVASGTRIDLCLCHRQTTNSSFLNDPDTDCSSLSN